MSPRGTHVTEECCPLCSGWARLMLTSLTLGEEQLGPLSMFTRAVHTGHMSQNCCTLACKTMFFGKDVGGGQNAESQGATP